MNKEKKYKVLEGSMLEILPTLEEKSFDCCITDPPYELNFMGKGWDNSGIAFQKETWEQVYRVLKSGAYLIAFGGSGSTGKAAMFENREREANYTITMIELTPEYVPIIKARCDYATDKYEYEAKQEEIKRKEKGEISIFDFTYDD